MTRRPLHIAHRGGTGLWPENTMTAFEHAIADGADGIELDVHLSRDGVLVVHHDESLKPAIARGPDGAWLTRPTPLVKDLDFDDLQAYDIGRLKPGSGYGARYPEQRPFDGARIPKLEDVIDLVQAHAPPGFRLYIELKTALLDLSQSAQPDALATAAVELVRKKKFEEQTWFVSFDWRALAHAKKLAPEIKNAFTTPGFYSLDPADPSKAHDNEAAARIRAASSAGADWMAGFDWRAQDGETFAHKMLQAITSKSGDRAPADGWFAWYGDVTEQTAGWAGELDLAVGCWTVDKPDDMKRLAAFHVEAILTDRLDVLNQTLSSEE